MATSSLIGFGVTNPSKNVRKNLYVIAETMKRRTIKIEKAAPSKAKVLEGKAA